jgi:hypothetical protein
MKSQGMGIKLASSVADCGAWVVLGMIAMYDVVIEAIAPLDTRSGDGQSDTAGVSIRA